jgi:hypothetical protein
LSALVTRSVTSAREGPLGDGLPAEKQKERAQARAKYQRDLLSFAYELGLLGLIQNVDTVKKIKTAAPLTGHKIQP